MIEIHGIETKVSSWPMKLGHFGLNPFGEPIFRVVWSDSRKYMIGGLWDGVRAEYRWIPKYEYSAWVLERWLSALEYGGTPQQYELQQRDEESGLLVCGPYPERGEYEFCHRFPPGHPSASQIEAEIQKRLYQRKYSKTEIRNALTVEQELKDARWGKRVDAIIDNAQGAFNNQATNIFPGKVTPDNYQFKKTAKELPLPDNQKRDGAFFTR
jgi:hypothetical protein